MSRENIKKILLMFLHKLSLHLPQALKSDQNHIFSVEVSTVFILDFYTRIYVNKTVWSHVLALNALPNHT